MKTKERRMLLGLFLLPVVFVGVPAVVSAQVYGLPEVLEAQQVPNYVSDEILLNADKDPNNWLLYGRDYHSTRFSPLDQINKGNVRNLVPKYIVSFGVVEGQDSQANAINGMIYVTTSFNRVLAVDGRNGRIVWKYERELPGDVYPHLCCDVVNRGVALYRDKVYLATLDAHVVALNNMTGEVIWDKKHGDYTYSESFTIMPMALRGKIIFGTSGAEYGVRGWIKAIDAETGDQVWQTYTIPGPGEPGNETWGGDSWKYGGGSAWVTGSYDPELNILYWPVGNPGPDFDRHVRPGDNLYTNCTLAMDPDTGKIKFWFQYTPNDPYDYDGVNEVVLADVQGRKVWLHGDRNGYFYAIDRTNGKFIYATAISRINWNKGFTREGRPIFNWPEKDVVYDRVTEDVAPVLDGGKEWHPIAYSPKTGLAYVPAFNMAMDLQAARMEWRRGEWYLGAKVLRLKPGHGWLHAIDAASGKIAWTRYNAMPMTSGVLATAGGLVFAGNPEGTFMAFDDTTGQELWRFNVGTGIHGNPTTFTVEGKQYVAIVAGAGGGGIWPLYYKEWLKTNTKGGLLVVFGLH